MPKVKNKNQSILIDNKKNFYVQQKHNQVNEGLENFLTSLMKTAKDHYETVYLKSKKKLNINAFSACKEKFQKIMSVIEHVENPTQLTNQLYFEAWISLLYADVHALNLDPDTEVKLNALHKKILEIETDFNQLQTKKSSLELSNSYSQLNYINDFHQFWLINKNRLLADCYYNFAEFFIKKSNFKKAIFYFKKSVNFYNETAKKSINPFHQKKFLGLANLTNQRCECAIEQFNENQYSTLTPPLKKLIVHLQKIPNSLSRWKVINKKSLFSQSKTKSSLKEINKNSKKIKKILPHCELAFLWKTARKKILDKFIEFNLDINLINLSNQKKSINERKAIVHNNYAIYLIESLITNTNYTEPEKLPFLEKAEQLLKKSSKLYENVDLLEKKLNVEQCANYIRSTRDNLENTIKDFSVATSKPITPFEKKYLEYQHTYSTRYALKFFKAIPMVENKQNSTQLNQKKQFNRLIRSS